MKSIYMGLCIVNCLLGSLWACNTPNSKNTADAKTKTSKQVAAVKSKSNSSNDKITTYEQALAAYKTINVSNTIYRQKGIQFDSIVTYAGTRTFSGTKGYDNRTDKIKIKLFYKNDWFRGYYNMHYNSTNLQIIGRIKNGQAIIRSITQLDPVESSSYFIANFDNKAMTGLAQTLEFKEKGTFNFSKQNIDYNELKDW